MVCSGSVVVCGAGRWWQCGASGGLVEWSGVEWPVDTRLTVSQRRRATGQ